MSGASRRAAVPLAAAVLLQLAAVVLRADPAPGFVLRSDGPWQIAELRAADCAVRLSFRADPPAAGYRDDCGGSPAESAARLARALDALAAAEPRVRQAQSLDCGRLVALPGEFALRLARAAQADPRWQEALRQRASSGSEGWANRWVADAVLSHGVLREYAEALRARGLVVTGASVEKVLVGTPGLQQELAPLAREGGAAPEAELPFDAIAWLRLAPAADGPIH